MSSPETRTPDGDPADPLGDRLRAALSPRPGRAERLIARALAAPRPRTPAGRRWATAASALLASILLVFVAVPQTAGRRAPGCAPGGRTASIESHGRYLVTRSIATGETSILHSGAASPAPSGTILIVRHGENR
jgi:hypothetical protein